MKIYYLIIITFLLLISCSRNNNDQSTKADYLYILKHNANMYAHLDSDSIPEDLWYAIIDLKPDYKVSSFKKLDELEVDFSNKIKSFKDSLLKSANTNEIPQITGYRYDNPTEMLKAAIEKGNLEMYCSLIRHETGLRAINFYPYSLYIAEKFNFAPAYYDTFFALKNLSHRQQANSNLKSNTQSLNGISTDLQKLAIYCLIKAYKKGVIPASNDLAFYFNEGIYLPKDADMANALEKIYTNEINNTSNSF